MRKLFLTLVCICFFGSMYGQEGRCKELHLNVWGYANVLGGDSDGANISFDYSTQHSDSLIHYENSDLVGDTVLVAVFPYGTVIEISNISSSDPHGGNSDVRKPWIDTVDIVGYLPDTIHVLQTLCGTASTQDLDHKIQVRKGQHGCDELVVTSYELLRATYALETVYTCHAERAGTSSNILVNAAGCDSVVTTEIIFVKIDTIVLEPTTCDPDQVDTIERKLTQEGCEQVVVTSYIYQPLPLTYTSEMTCKSMNQGVRIDSFLSVSGCDSLVSVELFYKGRDTTYLDSITCDLDRAGDTWVQLTDQEGCDSVVVTTFTYIPPSVDQQRFEICAGDSFFGVQMFSSQIIYDTTRSTYGCDSIMSIYDMVVYEVDPLSFLVEQNHECGESSEIEVLPRGENHQIREIWIDDELGDFRIVPHDAHLDLRIVDERGCVRDSTFFVDVWDRPRITLLGDTVIGLGEQLRVQALTSEQAVTWEYVDEKMLETAEAMKHLTLTPRTDFILHGTVRDSNECFNSASLVVSVDPMVQVYFPTAFSPNSDRQNDLFLPGWKRGIVQSVKQFEVFDRWGNSVYKASSIPAAQFLGWDGQMNGTPMGSGVYLYMITLEFIDSSTYTHSSDVFLSN